MIWQNLKKMRCPHCSAELFEDIHIVCCSECRFNISPERMLSIIEHRSDPERPAYKKKNKWQNLHDDRCPTCSKDLIPDPETRRAYLKCIDVDCTFKISEESMQRLLQDENHLCNLFRNRQQ